MSATTINTLDETVLNKNVASKETGLDKKMCLEKGENGGKVKKGPHAKTWKSPLLI